MNEISVVRRLSFLCVLASTGLALNAHAGDADAPPETGSMAGARGEASATVERERDGGTEETPPLGWRVPAFALEDQHRDLHAYQFPREEVTVLVLADRKGADLVEDWVRPLYERFENTVHIRGIAKVVGVPRLLRGLVRSAFRRQLGYPILLDWEGDVYAALEGGEETARLYVVDRHGKVTYAEEGQATEAKQTRLIGRIEALMGNGA